MKVFGWSSGFAGMPFFAGIEDEKNESRIDHDSYEVYVNGDYVGNKSLITQGEEISDIDKHLQLEGFKTFNEEVLGNHVDINTKDLDEAKRIKQNLNVYLKIR